MRSKRILVACIIALAVAGSLIYSSANPWSPAPVTSSMTTSSMTSSYTTTIFIAFMTSTWTSGSPEAVTTNYGYQYWTAIVTCIPSFVEPPCATPPQNYTYVAYYPNPLWVTEISYTTVMVPVLTFTSPHYGTVVVNTQHVATSTTFFSPTASGGWKQETLLAVIYAALIVFGAWLFAILRKSRAKQSCVYAS